MKLCERLKELRIEKGLTQDDVALKFKVSKEVIKNWENQKRNGEPSVEMLIGISNFYGVSIDYLCGVTDIKDRIYEDKDLCKYLNKCIAIYDEFFKKD
ncbi:HTH-type transcriptional regulator immR [uncultured Clostridium sp.]|uniref:helix-turn-helix domain-containing protein n=1 Tax=uncultured Clostridium sp. TaxID=59620 RepID=UPI000820A2A5|nr:helix-turn-helix transcriptional regulator [uncultured Clostridium sp.]SCJ50076.1 HTH-type transcriptional regulator immR [uncultured Clostridium sp.]